MSESIRVLHVDDEPDFADMTSIFLENEHDDLTVITESSAEAGLERLADADGVVDCVVSDYRMPGMDGLDFLEAIREDHPDLPFILFTGQGSEEIASDAISAGVTDYFPKPAGGAVDQYAVLANRIVSAVEKTRVETELEHTTQRYTSLVQTAPVPIVIYRPDGEIIEANDAAASFIGGDDIDDLIGQNGIAMIHPDDRSTAKHRLSKVFNEQKKVDLTEYRLIGLDDEIKYAVFGTSRMMYDGAPAGQTIIHDLTEHKEREEALERYEKIIEASGDAVYTLDTDGRFTFVNEAFETISGYSAGELLDEHVSMVMNDEDVAKGEALIQELLKSDDRDHDAFEMELITADGSRITTEVHIALLSSDDGFRGTTGIHRDITERKRRERELRRQNERLEEFASVVSHDLRNPLNVAEGRLELAREECESDQLEAMTEALDRMDELISDLLTLARQGQTVHERELVPLDELADLAWHTVSGDEGELRIDDELDSVACDESRLRRLLENLFRNAREHAGHDVTVRVGSLDDGFYVADDGPGIPEEERDRVLQAGYSTSEEGAGFGLNIVKQIVEAHGWAINVTEGTDGGARFEITNVEMTQGNHTGHRRTTGTFETD